MRLFIVQLLVVSLFVSVNAYGHLAGITDSSIQIGHTKIKLVYTAPIDNLEELFPGQDIEAVSQEALYKAIARGFVFTNNQKPCLADDVSHNALPNVASWQFSMFFKCNDNLDELDIRYLLFHDRFDNHENFTRVSMGGKYISYVFTKEQQSLRVPVKATLQEWGTILSDNFVDDPNKNFSLQAKPNYFPLGIEHIILGFDHLLFLFALLLLPLKFKQLLIMVTSFTVAHSITLAMAVFDVVSLPAIWVEVVIALSIVYVGVENLIELRNESTDKSMNTPWKRRVCVTFGFGLIHGFGFSYVLKEIGLGDQVASALLFFNLGVEVGQIIAVVLVFPLLVLVFRRWPGFVFSKLCSVAVILMGGFWMVERLMSALG